MSIDVQHVSKAFGSFAAVRDVSFTVAGGELLALLGPSGCGKTTLLRIIAGLETSDAGRVLLEGADATSQDVRQRGVGFVFQHYALFRHMTVFENVAFGLRVKPRSSRPPASAIARRVHDLLALVQLDYLADRYPSQLSGGQRQRVALARALAVEPKVLLLDEPFGALDANVRRDLRRWLRRLHDEIKLTSVFVTHDQEEAFDLADRVIIMNHGRVEQDGHPAAVLDDPATPFVMNFIGQTNRFHGEIADGRATFGSLAVDYVTGGDRAPQPASAYTRPHEFRLSRTEEPGGMWGRVAQVTPAGALLRLEVLTDEYGPIHIELARHVEAQYAPGDRVYAVPTRLRIFPDRTSEVR